MFSNRVHTTYIIAQCRPPYTNWQAVKNKISAQTGLMQHVTVVIARKRYYCITMGWSRLLLVKRKIRIKTTTTNNNMGFRSWLEATHADDFVHMDETLRIIHNLCEDVTQDSLKQVPWERFMYMYHGTVWCLYHVPQRWKWQSLDILVVVHGHGRDFAGSHPSIQKGKLDATPGIRTSHGPMVRRIWQVELCTLPPMLLRSYVSAAHTPPRCARWIHARRVFSSA